MPSPTSTGLRERYDNLRTENPKIRIRDAASLLEVSEAELVALECGRDAIRLSPGDWRTFLPELKALGRVMVLTRNEHCVHERSGLYETIQVVGGGAMGLVTGKDIDLRLFLGAWRHTFAVTTPGPRGAQLRSIQFFDSHGDAIHKVYARDEGALPAYEDLVTRFSSADQSSEQVVAPRPSPVTRSIPTDPAPLLHDWAELRDTHDFHDLLKRHGFPRHAALAAAEGRFTRRVTNDSPRRILEAAAEAEAPIMVFTGNPGAVQIHTGPVSRVVPHGEWINVLDPDFNLHLRESGIDRCWVVEKPTTDGTVTSLEAYAPDGTTLVQFFGARKPGQPEREDWRTLIKAL